MILSKPVGEVHSKDSSVLNQPTRERLLSLSRRHATEAAARWGCRHIDFAREVCLALAAFEAGALSCYEDELGDESFLVRDANQPDGNALAGRHWCTCDPVREEAETCWHSLAVRLQLCFESHYARLCRQAGILPAVQNRTPAPEPTPQEPTLDTSESQLADDETEALKRITPPPNPNPSRTKWGWVSGPLPKPKAIREDQKELGRHLRSVLAKLGADPLDVS